MHDPVFATLVFFAVVTAAIGGSCIVTALGDTKKVRTRSAVTIALMGIWIAVITAFALAGTQAISTIAIVIFFALVLLGWGLGGGRG